MGMSKGRAWAVVTILVVACLVALGLGLGLGLSKSDSSKTCSCETTTPTPDLPPLGVKPSVAVEGHYRFAAVAPDAPECATIGTYKNIMAVEGGTAIDAAIAAILCVCVFNAQSCGIGGGHFMTYYNRSSGEALSINAREQAPSGATEDMFAAGKNTTSMAGGLSIGIPGEVKGLYEAHKLGGRIPWAKLFEPTIKLCEEGIPMGNALHRTLTFFQAYTEEFPNFKELMTNPETGQLFKPGEIMKRPKLARTLSIIAAEGPDAFYNGSLSKDIIADMAEAGGIITEEDLANYTALVQPSLRMKLRPDFTVFSPPLPSSGAAYLAMLNILSGYNMTADSMSSVEDAVLTFHRTSEAFKHAFAQRTRLGDNNVGSESFRNYVDDMVAKLTSEEFGEEIRRKIDDARTFAPDYYDPLFSNAWDQGTAHLAVLGPNGDAVTITSTVNIGFGSKVVGSRTGIIFNNEMGDFSTPGATQTLGASEANFIKPWKRPLSSMCPSVVVKPDGDVALVVGAAGGTKILTTMALVTMETLWFNWTIKEAVDYPRIHHQLLPNVLTIEPEMPQAVIDGLRQKGHTIKTDMPFRSVSNCIWKEDGEITAISDYRKDGTTDGF